MLIKVPGFKLTLHLYILNHHQPRVIQENSIYLWTVHTNEILSHRGIAFDVEF